MEDEDVELLLRAGKEEKVGNEISMEEDCLEDDERVTILFVHGGPGLSNHLELYSLFFPAPPSNIKPTSCLFDHCGKMVERVIFYEQLGVGQSEKPDGPDRQHCLGFSNQVLQLHELFTHYSKLFKNLFVFGHSFGGQLLLEALFGIQQPERSCIKGAIICNAPLHEQSYSEKQAMMRAALDKDTLSYYEEENSSIEKETPYEYSIYKQLIGTGDWKVDGEMKDWSAIDRISSIATPCLFISGTYDTIPYEEYQNLKFGNQLSKAIVLENGGHAPFVEPEVKSAFWSCLTDFISRC